MTLIAYVGAALAEIAGCFAFWAWLRFDKSPWWVGPRRRLTLPLRLLTLIDVEHAGRGYAAYGAISSLGALCWLWLAEGVAPIRWDRVASRPA